MKISVLAKKVKLSPSTIRFYIDKKIIFPKKVNGQYYFEESDVRALTLVNMWKKWDLP